MFGWLVTARPEPCKRCGEHRHLLARTDCCSPCTVAEEKRQREAMLRELRAAR